MFCKKEPIIEKSWAKWYKECEDVFNTYVDSRPRYRISARKGKWYIDEKYLERINKATFYSYDHEFKDYSTQPNLSWRNLGEEFETLGEAERWLKLYVQEKDVYYYDQYPLKRIVDFEA